MVEFPIAYLTGDRLYLGNHVGLKAYYLCGLSPLQGGWLFCLL